MNMHVRQLRHPELGHPSVEFTYHDESGQPVLVAARFDQPDGDKTFRLYDTRAGRWKAPESRPLYRLDEIATADADRPVIMVEGEKCADALAGQGYLATTTANGAKAPLKTDLSPLCGRDVILWPDHDPAGLGYVESLAVTLHKEYGARPHTVPVSDETLSNITLHRESGSLTYPRGWDAADAVAEGWTPKEIDQLLALAEPYVEPEAPDSEAEAGDLGIVELWHAPDGAPYATIEREGHREHWPIESKHFGSLLSLQHYRAEGKAPTPTALDAEKRRLTGEAVHDGEEHPCFTRIGQLNGALWLDLGTADWSAVKITAEGWTIEPEPEARFSRAKGTRGLPVPAPGTGDIDLLRDFLNVESEDDYRLIVGWLLGCFQPTGPYPILILTGEQGSAKSTTAKVLRRVIDPARPDSRSAPKDERDLVIAARNSHVLSFDNLSRIKPDLADAFCRIAAGGGFGTRMLHTNAEEMLFDVTRPCLLNGIPDLAARPDLADRSIIVTLPMILETPRQYEAAFWRDFEAAQPRILAGLLDAAATALARVDAVELLKRPRMADFARWVTAAEPALGWPEGAFMAAYEANREDAGDTALDGSPVASAIIRFLAPGTSWRGTIGELKHELQTRLPGLANDPHAFPRELSQFGTELKRLRPVLRGQGIDVTHERVGQSRRRVVTLKRE